MNIEFTIMFYMIAFLCALFYAVLFTCAIDQDFIQIIFFSQFYESDESWQIVNVFIEYSSQNVQLFSKKIYQFVILSSEIYNNSILFLFYEFDELYDSSMSKIVDDNFISFNFVIFENNFTFTSLNENENQNFNDSHFIINSLQISRDVKIAFWIVFNLNMTRKSFRNLIFFSWAFLNIQNLFFEYEDVNFEFINNDKWNIHNFLKWIRIFCANWTFVFEFRHQSDFHWEKRQSQH